MKLRICTGNGIYYHVVEKNNEVLGELIPWKSIESDSDLISILTRSRNGFYIIIGPWPRISKTCAVFSTLRLPPHAAPPAPPSPSHAPPCPFVPSAH